MKNFETVEPAETPDNIELYVDATPHGELAARLLEMASRRTGLYEMPGTFKLTVAVPDQTSNIVSLDFGQPPID